MKTHADLILRDAVIHGAEGSADAVTVTGGVIAAVGREADLMGMAGPDTAVIDCGGRRVVPGIVDAHCHLFAAAAARDGVDCRPTATPTVSALIAALRAAGPDADGWMRGYGYDDSPVGLGHRLTRHDLDAVSEHVPALVRHRSGHAVVMNGAGLRVVGISAETHDPPGGTIERDASGEPTGLLLDMQGWLRERIGASPQLRRANVWRRLRILADAMLAYGITAATDAGPENGPQRWSEFGAAISDGVLATRVTMMVGHAHLAEMRAAGFGYGDGDCEEMLSVGHAKIMLTASSGRLHPHPQELCDTVAAAHRIGFPVAVHAVEQDAVVASALAIAEHPAPAGRDRIEHCAECPPDVADLVAQSKARVVTNTGFLHYDGERYRKTVSGDLLPHLYPAGALHSMGVPVALASDAPVVEPNPWAAMAAAVSRRDASGVALGGVAVPSVADALAMHTGGNRIAAGCPADLAVLESDPLAIAMADLPGVRAALTVVGGRIARRRGI